MRSNKRWAFVPPAVTVVSPAAAVGVRRGGGGGGGEGAERSEWQSGVRCTAETIDEFYDVKLGANHLRCTQKLNAPPCFIQKERIGAATQLRLRKRRRPPLSSAESGAERKTPRTHMGEAAAVPVAATSTHGVGWRSAATANTAASAPIFDGVTLELSCRREHAVPTRARSQLPALRTVRLKERWSFLSESKDYQVDFTRVRAGATIQEARDAEYEHEVATRSHTPPPAPPASDWRTVFMLRNGQVEIEAQRTERLLKRAKEEPLRFWNDLLHKCISLA